MTHLGIYSSKAQDASGPHRPDLNIPGLIMGGFFPPIDHTRIIFPP
jgi:hypothetical protein